MGVLKVHLVNCTNLKDADGAGNKSDPYVKLEVYKDGWVHDKVVASAESKHIQGNLNPVFNQDFDMGVPELKDHVLSVVVMDEDVGKDDKLGSGKIKLGAEHLEPHKPKTFKVKVDDNLFTKDAFCELVLTWNP